MDSNSLNNEWKEKLMELKNENKFNMKKKKIIQLKEN